MVQCPQEKCNWGLVLSGEQGIGKDAALLPVKSAIGNWNAQGIDPDRMLDSFKPWLETLLLTIDEVRPNKDDHRASAFYNTLKPYLAAPPETLEMNRKFMQPVYVMNVMRVVMTTNDKHSLYIPVDDRRIFMMHSLLPSQWHEKEEKPDYFTELFDWMHKRNGFAHVAAFLRERDISKFNPKASPPRTLGWGLVHDSWTTPEDILQDAIRSLAEDEHRRRKNEIEKNESPDEKVARLKAEEAAVAEEADEEIDVITMPDIFFGKELIDITECGAQDDIRDLLRNSRKLQHRMSAIGYEIFTCKTQMKWRYTCKNKKTGELEKFESMHAFVSKKLLSTYPSENNIRGQIKNRGKEIVRRLANKTEAEKAADKAFAEQQSNVFRHPTHDRKRN